MNDITPDLEAAMEFVDSMKTRPDTHSPGGTPLWQEWALRVAFLQGAQFGRDEINQAYEEERKG